MPLESDVYDEPGSVREDGRAITPAFLFEVKTPAESHSEWDNYKLLAPVPRRPGLAHLGRGRLQPRPVNRASGPAAGL
jgi:branched-chain amino acid transport system substrate-binding protein